MLGLQPERNRIEIAVPVGTSAASLRDVDAAIDRHGGAFRVELPGERFSARTDSCTWIVSNPNVLARTIACSRPYHGGQRIDHNSYPGWFCTGAFRVRSVSDAKPYVATAGHCADDNRGVPWAARIFSNDPRDLGVAHNYKFGFEGDTAIVRAEGSFWDTSPWPSQVVLIGTPNPEGWATHPITAQAIPDQWGISCHTGVTTGTTCGTVVNQLRSVYYAGEGVTVGHVFEVQGACSEGGDSGGPWYAYGAPSGHGIHSRSANGGTCASTYSFATLAVALEYYLNVWVGGTS